MKKSDLIIKRIFDLMLALFLLIVLGWIVFIFIFIARLNTNQSGVFSQKRVGQYGNTFNIYKIRSIIDEPDGSKRTNRIGQFLRKSKLDELPQLYNVLIGNMSFVGPRPDVEGFADKLKGEDRIILSIKPGITGLATLYFKNEETLLAKQTDPLAYNEEIIWPKKIELNKIYIREYSFYNDLKIIFRTIFNK